MSLPLVPVVPANNTVLWSGPGLPSPPALTMQREPSPILLSNRRRDIPPGGDAVSPTAPPPVTLKAAAAGDPGPQAHTEGVIPRSGRRHPRGLSRSTRQDTTAGRSIPKQQPITTSSGRRPRAAPTSRLGLVAAGQLRVVTAGNPYPAARGGHCRPTATVIH